VSGRWSRGSRGFPGVLNSLARASSPFGAAIPLPSARSGRFVGRLSNGLEFLRHQASDHIDHLEQALLCLSSAAQSSVIGPDLRCFTSASRYGWCFTARGRMPLCPQSTWAHEHDIWSSNGPVFAPAAFTQFWLDFCDVFRACCILLKLAYPATERPHGLEDIAGNAGPSWQGVVLTQ
jgi:hypothetical protein